MRGRFLTLLLGASLALVNSGAPADQVCKYDSIRATAPASRFTDNGDATVTDIATGLMWKRCSEGQIWDGSTCTGSAPGYTWQQALQLADAASWAGKSDWRLPNVKELASIVEQACSNPVIDLTIFPGMPPTPLFWSSSPSAYENGEAWNFNFHFGLVGTHPTLGAPHVRLVRGGQALFSVPSPLNDTGLDWWADRMTNYLPSEPAGYPGQDASHGRDITADNDADGHAGFSFTKLDANGNALPAGAASWSCVRDEVTGKIWEVKTDDGGLRDRDWGYTWYNPDPATNGGEAGTPDGTNHCFYPTRCDTQKFVADVNAAGLCGAADWRLPTLDELLSVVDYSRYSPAIDTLWFPNVGSYWYYWSSSPSADGSIHAWRVYFNLGKIAYSFKRAPFHVRLVRGAPDSSLVATAVAGPGGTVSPGRRIVSPGATAQFRVMPDSGYDRTDWVGGTCPHGSWSGNTWITGAVYASCTVSFSFSASICWECLPGWGGWRAVLP